MKALALAIGKFQYQDILLFLEAQERFNLATQYLKYRPNLNEFKGHYKEWWHFAYKAILEEKVRRRRSNWSWPRMKAHRKLVKDYRDAWLKVMTEKSPGAAVQEIIKKGEEELDVFNVNVARQQAEMEIDRKGLKRVEDQPQGWIAWGASWFGGGGGETPNAGKKKDFAEQFNEAMTPEEKAKLFEAIDYQVAVIVDGAVSLFLLDLRAAVEQRPSASAMNLKSTIQELRMDGCGAEMLRVRDPSKPWLDLCVDTNPLHGKYDQSVQLAIAPINLKYHAPAVNNAADVFKPPESVKLNQLTAAAMSRYEEVKARSATGLAHAVENRSRLVLDIQIQPATIYISEGGVYDANKPTLLADLGLLSITTVESDPDALAHKDKLHQLMDKAYDKFRVKLSNVVVSMAEIGVIVLRKDDVLCEVSILRMGCKLQMRTFDMVVTAELGAIRVSMPMFKSIDPKRKFLYFIDNDEEEGSLMTLKKLLSVAGEKEMLRFEMVQYQRTDEQKKLMQPTDIDMSVKVRLAQMRFVFLNLWLCRLMAWMAPFQEEAARAAAAAQAAASEKAAEAAQNVKQ
ncbi:hypothetical protein ANCDUO_16942, partial [Ancylostoma duodenale]